MLSHHLMEWVKIAGPSVKNEDGQDLAEYALILVFIAVVAVAAITALGGTVSGMFEQINTGLSS